MKSDDAKKILDAAVGDNQQTMTTTQHNPNIAVEKCLHVALDANRIDSVTIVTELEQTLHVFTEIKADIKRIADHFDPPPPDIVDTPYIAQRLGCTTTWIAQMVRNGEIPKSCVVPGSGKGRQWKFFRRQIEAWLSNR